MTYLVDTSVWIDFLRAADSPARSSLRSALQDEEAEVVTCEPIAMELLAGPADDVQLARLTRLVDGLPTIPVDPRRDFRDAAAIYRSARRAGVTVRNLPDCLIAAIAIRADVELIHKDADFEKIGRVTPLRGRSWR